eukprot:TRINITY_DN53452_c0_g1_i1.p1 TRINITY_DN53452_c0_g1~~TRINITY_DN53452_c0_g1_i1.p1  ORF type:complete len:913 (+),score=273.98 TRINITY_DN53452_c0_g1_i1:95-2833(+)
MSQPRGRGRSSAVPSGSGSNARFAGKGATSTGPLRRSQPLSTGKEAIFAATALAGGTSPTFQFADENCLQQSYEEEDRFQRHSRDQNQVYWEACLRKDEQLEAVEQKCAELHEELLASESSALESWGKLEARSAEAEQNLNKAREDLRTSRREASERVRRHAEDMEALSDTLCTLQSRIRDAEAALQSSRKEAESLKIELNACSPDAVNEEREATRSREAALLEQIEEGERLRAEKEAMLQKSLQDEELRANAEMVEVRHLSDELAAGAKKLTDAIAEQKELMEEVASAEKAKLAAEESQMVEAQTASACEESAESALVSVAAMQKALSEAESEMQSALCRASAEEVALQHADEDRLGALDEAHAARARADRFEARLKEAAEELRSEQLHREAGEKIASGTQQMLTAAQKRAADADEKRVQAERLFFAEQLSTKRDEAAAIEAEERKCRSMLGAEVIEAAAANRALAEAEKSQSLLRTNLDEAEVRISQQYRELEAAAKDAEVSSERASNLEGLLAEEKAVAEERLAEALKSHEKAASDAAATLKDSLEATKASESREDALAAELSEEAAMQESLRKQAFSAKAQALRLQESAELRAEVDEERSKELEQLRADATRHARGNTELRAELADTKRELSKCRHAARSLTQVSDELEQALVKLRKATLGREALEGELDVRRRRQTELERQLKELKAGIVTGVTGSLEPWGASPGYAQTATTWLTPEGRGAVSTGAVAFGATTAAFGPTAEQSYSGLRRVQSVDALTSHEAMSGRTEVNAAAPVPASPASGTVSPGIGRSHSMGPFRHLGGIDDTGASPKVHSYEPNANSGAGLSSSPTALTRSRTLPLAPVTPPTGAAAAARPPPAPGPRQGWGAATSSAPMSRRSEVASPASRPAHSARSRSSEDGVSAIDKVVR